MELNVEPMVYTEWWRDNLCYGIYAIFIPSNKNSIQVALTYLCFQASLVSCHKYWQKRVGNANVQPPCFRTSFSCFMIQKSLIHGLYRVVAHQRFPLFSANICGSSLDWLENTSMSTQPTVFPRIVSALEQFPPLNSFRGNYSSL